MAVSLLTGIGRLLALLVFVTAAYRALLAVAFLIGRRRRAQPPRAEVALRFATLIPAHDEVLLVGASIDSVRRAYANAEGCDVYVIADNCSDATAQVAADHGAKVLVRRDPQRGKGWVLDWAVSQIDLQGYDAVAVIDADNLVDPEFFREMMRRLADGARILQGYDGIANPEETPLTRLISITSVMKNLLYNGGKAALGLSPHLMGTGMVFRAETLAAHGWRSHSIVENIEQSLLLLLAGERIWHVPEARVYAQEAATFEQALPQRQRWASGQAALSRRALHTVARGITTRRWSLIDAGADLLLPFRYSKLLYCTIAALGICLAISPAASWTIALVALAALLQAFELLTALRLMPRRRRVLGSALVAAVFLVWKAWIDVLAIVG